MNNIIQKPSPNCNERKGLGVSLIILHYTGMKTAAEALDRLTDAKAQVSSHYTIDEEGGVYQHVDEQKRAWHAGKAFWQGEADINSISIGVEIVNPGHEFGYRDFPAAQIDAVKKLCRQIMARHNIEAVLAHSDIAPDRKEDPGELFPWEELAAENIGVWPAVSDEDLVNSADIDVSQALRDLGYGDAESQETLIAFQRHFVPEVFKAGTQGQACDLTKARLNALLTGNMVAPQ